MFKIKFFFKKNLYIQLIFISHKNFKTYKNKYCVSNIFNVEVKKILIWFEISFC